MPGGVIKISYNGTSGPFAGKVPAFNLTVERT
jgi:hypothetical protein